MDDAVMQRQSLEAALAPLKPAQLEKADPKLVTAKIRPTYRSDVRKLELSVELRVEAPGLELSTFGASINFKVGGKIPYREAQFWGSPYAKSFAAGGGINPVDLPAGRHKATWIVLTTVKLAENHWVAWDATDTFEFDV